MTQIVRGRIAVTGYYSTEAHVEIVADAATLYPTFIRRGSRWYVNHRTVDAYDPAFTRWHSRIVAWLNANGERDALQRAVERIERQQAAHVALASD